MNGTNTMPGMELPIMGGSSGNPYETKVGGGSGGGIQIPNIQYQSPKNQQTSQQSVPMQTPGSGLAQATPTITDNLKQAYNLYQQRFGQGNTAGNNLPMNSNAGGVWAGNPNQLQVGPETPTAPQAAATNPGVATQSPAIDQANAANSPMAGGGDGGSSAMGGAGAGAGMGIASALGSVSKAFGKESETDAKLAANPPKPTVTGQPFANFAFTPMFGGGGLA
jgi:hypothetical protein